jgi:cobalt-zinc-cadmium efflux system membrane fusion protein
MKPRHIVSHAAPIAAAIALSFMLAACGRAQPAAAPATPPQAAVASAGTATQGHGDHDHDHDHHHDHEDHDHHDAGAAGGIVFTKERQAKVDFAVEPAVEGIARASIFATGTVRALPGGEARIVAPAAGVLLASGRFPRIGQRVRKGEVLAVLSPRLGGDADQASLEAAAAKAEIALELARGERERMDRLFKEEAVAEKRLLEARANERIAESEAHAAAARARQSGGGVALRAPIDGIVADVAAAAGAFVNEGAPLLHIADADRLWLEVRVSESDIGRLGTPRGAAFKVDGYERDFAIEVGRDGKLIAVGGVVDARTRTVPVVFEFANPDRTLRLGLTAKVQVFAGAGADKASVLVPAGAIQDENGMSVAYVQTGEERFERRLVRTGPRDGERIAVLEGIEAGERVVGKGAYLVRLSTSTSASAGHAGHNH